MHPGERSCRRLLFTAAGQDQSGAVKASARRVRAEGRKDGNGACERERRRDHSLTCS